MPTASPWGDINRYREIDPGILEVFPPKAMGTHLMIAAAVAETRLSSAARRRATRFEGFYCFGSEAGGTWAIAAWELKSLQATLFKEARCIREQGIDAYLLRRLSQFQIDYLKEAGITPDPSVSPAPIAAEHQGGENTP
ncbi:MAG: hypothetical protein ABIL58_08115 [Pseudomonadota bacterium]